MNPVKLLIETPYHLFFGLIGILGIALLIGIHEMGHFLFAKLFNVHTPSFSIGFGPRIFSKKVGTTLFSLSAVPLGGYVEISGMAELGQGEQKSAHHTGEDSFGVKSYWQKMLILFGGILFNLIFAYVSLMFLFILGAPKSELLSPLGIIKHKSIIRAVAQGSPAEKAFLEPGDEILQITLSNGESVSINNEAEILVNTIKSHPKETLTLSVKRVNREPFSVDITTESINAPNKDGLSEEIGTWGAALEIKDIPSYSLTEGILEGVRATNTYILMTIKAFKNMFIQRNMKGVGGPVMIISETMKGAQKGFKIFFLFLAIISINLAVLNLLPLPILDGGQILFVTIETLLGKQLPKLREYIHIGSWLFILALIVFLTIRDLGILKWLGFE